MRKAYHHISCSQKGMGDLFFYSAHTVLLALEVKCTGKYIKGRALHHLEGLRLSISMCSDIYLIG